MNMKNKNKKFRFFTEIYLKKLKKRSNFIFQLFAQFLLLLLPTFKISRMY